MAEDSLNQCFRFSLITVSVLLLTIKCVIKNIIGIFHGSYYYFYLLLFFMVSIDRIIENL